LGRVGFAAGARLQVRSRMPCARNAAKGAPSGRSFATAAHRLPALRALRLSTSRPSVGKYPQ